MTEHVWTAAELRAIAEATGRHEEPATEAKQDALIAKDFATQTTLAAILAKIIAAPATEAKQTAMYISLNALIGEVQASPTANTLLARLKSLEDKIAGITSGTTPATTTLTGSIPEYGWLDTDDPVTPNDPTKFAVGVEINTITHEMTTKYWTGSAWQEVL